MKIEAKLVKEERYKLRINWLIDNAIFYLIDEYPYLQNQKTYTGIRKRGYTYVRCIVWYNLRRTAKLSYVVLGSIFNRSHDTVGNALGLYIEIRNEFLEFRELTDTIEKEFDKAFCKITEVKNVDESLQTFMRKTLEAYANENCIIQRTITDISPLERYLIERLYEKSTIVIKEKQDGEI